MGAIHVRHGDNVAWEENRTGDSNGPVRWGIRTKPYFDPAEVGVLLRVVEYAPDYVVEAHSHAAPEIVYILDGEITYWRATSGRRATPIISSPTPCMARCAPVPRESALCCCSPACLE